MTAAPLSRARRVAIVGCGPMARNHVRLLSGLVPSQELALCDRDPVRLSDAAAAWGIDRTYSDLASMLEEFRPEIVHIVTPPATHRDLAVQCMAAGAHVLIEKPMCLSSVEADEIIAASQRFDRLVAVDHMRSFDPLTLRAKALVSSGQLGSIVRISVGYSHDYLQRRHADPAARWMADLPGGWVFDLMPHVLCLVDDFLPDVEVAHTTLRHNDDGVISDLACVLTSPAGDAQVHMSLDVVPLKNLVEIECTRGTVRVDFRNFLLTVRRHRGLPNAVERVVGNLSLGGQVLGGSLSSVGGFVTGRLDSYAGLGRIIGDFHRAVANGGASPVSPEAARRLLMLTERMLEGRDNSTPTPTPVWRELAPAEVLVTGGTGFIGRPLVERLVASGQRVRVLTHRDPSAEERQLFADAGVELVGGNVADPEAVRRACDGVTAVYHLAAAMGGDWSYHLDTTVTGTQVVLEAARDSGVERLVYVSTLNVYDASRYPDGAEIDEAFPDESQPERRGAYSHAKLLAEREVRAFDPGSTMSILVVRPGLVYGPGGPGLPADVGIRVGRRAVVVPGGSRRIPVVFITNLVDALVEGGRGDAVGRQSIVNVVDPDYPSQRRYLQRYRELTGERLVALYVPFPMISVCCWMAERVFALGGTRLSLRHKVASVRHSPRHSTRRAAELLGWQAAVGFDEALALTVGPHGSHPAR